MKTQKFRGTKEEAEKAIQEWSYRHHKGMRECSRIVSGGWRLRRHGRKRVAPFVVLYNEGDAYPWCVQCNGNGHYYQTAADMHRDLLIADDWVNSDQLDAIKRDEDRFLTAHCSLLIANC